MKISGGLFAEVLKDGEKDKCTYHGKMQKLS